MTEPVLLRVPEKFQTVEQVLGAAAKMDLPNVVLISEMENGNICFLSSEMSVSEVNWLLDRLKAVMLFPGSHKIVGSE